MKVSFGQKTFVSELDRNSESISSTNDSFRHYAEDLQLWSFYETLPSSLVLTSAIIVDKVSATLGYAKERVSLLNADHRGVCKFSLPSDPNYKILRNAFITTVDTILSESITIVEHQLIGPLMPYSLSDHIRDLEIPEQQTRGTDWCN